MLEKPKFVPMARPYASRIPNLFISIPSRALLRASLANNTPPTPFKINLKPAAVFKLILKGVVRHRQRRARGTKSRLHQLCVVAPLPGQSSTPTLVGGELWFGRGALRNAGEAEIRTYGSSVCFPYTRFIYIYSFSDTRPTFRSRITRRQASSVLIRNVCVCVF